MPMRKQFREEVLYQRLGDIISKFGTPFHLYDEVGIRENLGRLKKAFGRNWFNFKEFYAVKALPRPAIMDIIIDEQCGFDCSSIPELWLARNAGAKPMDIMFTSNNTSHDEFAEALKHDGCILNLDDTVFLDHPLVKNGPRDLFCCRLNPGSRKTGDEVNQIIGNPLENKYGVPIEQIVDLYRRAHEEMKYERYGLHVMVCSNDRNYLHMVNTVKLLLEIAAELKEKLGITLDFINMGGGIGIAYRPDDNDFDVEALAGECVRLATQFKGEHGYIPALYMESGRFVTGPHGVLVNRVINTYSKYKDFIGVEVAMPANMRVGMYGAYHHCELLNADGSPVKDGDRLMKKVTVAGSICESIDILAKDVMLPEAQPGDILLTYEDGAHTAAMTFNYGGRPRPQELLYRKSNTVSRIWKAETNEDMICRAWGLDGPEHYLHL